MEYRFDYVVSSPIQFHNTFPNLQTSILVLYLHSNNSKAHFNRLSKSNCYLLFFITYHISFFITPTSTTPLTILFLPLVQFLEYQERVSKGPVRVGLLLGWYLPHGLHPTLRELKRAHPQQPGHPSYGGHWQAQEFGEVLANPQLLRFNKMLWQIEERSWALFGL